MSNSGSLEQFRLSPPPTDPCRLKPLLGAHYYRLDADRLLVSYNYQLHGVKRGLHHVRGGLNKPSEF